MDPTHRTAPDPVPGADLHAYLRRRTAAAFRQFRRALAGLDAGVAQRDALPDWRRYRHGEHLDGSILGIVRHVAGWKLAAAATLRGEAPLDLSHLASWDEHLQLLEAAQRDLEQLLASAAPPWLATRVVLAGEEMTVADLLAHLLEHDQYHAGQVNLLRLRYGPPPEQEG